MAFTNHGQWLSNVEDNDVVRYRHIFPSTQPQNSPSSNVRSNKPKADREYWKKDVLRCARHLAKQRGWHSWSEWVGESRHIDQGCCIVLEAILRRDRTANAAQSLIDE